MKRFKPALLTLLTAAACCAPSAMAQPVPLDAPSPERLKALAAAASALSPDAGAALAAGNGTPLLEYSEANARQRTVWGLQLGTQSGLIACQAGHLHGCRLQALYMARLLPPNRTTEQFNTALAHGERACQAGHAPSCEATALLAQTRHATGSASPPLPAVPLPPGCTRGDTDFAESQMVRALEAYRGQVKVFVDDFHRMIDAVESGRMPMKRGSYDNPEFVQTEQGLSTRRGELVRAAERLHKEHQDARCLPRERLALLVRERDAWHPGPQGQAPRRPSVYSWSCDGRDGSRSTDHGPKDYCTRLQRGTAD